MMFSEEVKQTVYLAVTCCLLAVVLSFAAVFIGLRNDMATVRNEQIITTRTQKQTNEFSQYDGKLITGAEVIQGIRDYYKSEDVCVYVYSGGMIDVYSYKCDREGLYGTPLTSSELNKKYSLVELQKVFNASAEYEAYSLYGFPVFNSDMNEIVEQLNNYDSYRGNVFSTDVTAIYIIEK